MENVHTVFGPKCTISGQKSRNTYFYPQNILRVNMYTTHAYCSLLKHFGNKSICSQIFGLKWCDSGQKQCVHFPYVFLPKHFGSFKCIQFHIVFSSICLIKSTYDSNCLFSSVLACINTGDTNYTATNLHLQLLGAMADHPETYYVSYSNHSPNYFSNYLLTVCYVCKFISIINF